MRPQLFLGGAAQQQGVCGGILWQRCRFTRGMGGVMVRECKCVCRGGGSWVLQSRSQTPHVCKGYTRRQQTARIRHLPNVGYIAVQMIKQQ